MSLALSIPDINTFYVYSITLEEEAAERHDELADVMEVHNNQSVADTFRQLAHYSRLHAAEIQGLAAKHELPVIAPWDFDWEHPEGPETTAGDSVHYLMSVAQALQIAMNNERRAHDFYQDISEHSPVQEIRRTAGEFAAEELEHLNLLQAWIDDLPEADHEPGDDPDQAHMPE